MAIPPMVDYFESKGGAQIFQMPLEAFPGLETYLVNLMPLTILLQNPL